MSNNGYIKLRRSSQDNPLYFAEPFTRWQARQDMLLLANHSDGFFYVRGNRIDVKRGQIARGEKDLCARRKRSRDKTRRFLNDLEKMQQIIQQKNRICSLYIIVNYDRYQTTDQTTDQTTEKHQTRQQKNINNKNKEGGEEKKEEIDGIELKIVSLSSKEYDKLLERYPKKAVHDKILSLETYCRNLGKKGENKYKDYYLTVINWLKGDNIKENPKQL